MSEQLIYRLERNPLTVMDGQNITQAAADRIRELEANEHVAEQALAEYGKQSDKITELEGRLEAVNEVGEVHASWNTSDEFVDGWHECRKLVAEVQAQD